MTPVTKFGPFLMQNQSHKSTQALFSCKKRGGPAGPPCGLELPRKPRVTLSLNRFGAPKARPSEITVAGGGRLKVRISGRRGEEASADSTTTLAGGPGLEGVRPTFIDCQADLTGSLRNLHVSMTKRSRKYHGGGQAKLGAPLLMAPQGRQTGRVEPFGVQADDLVGAGSNG